MTLAHLPIDDVLPEVIAALRQHSSLVLRAPTGAGKTTRVPPALLDAGIADGPSGPRAGQILLLEPRRIAAQSAAERMASERGEQLGESIGYHVRLDRVVGPRTRIVAMTDGIFLRRMHDDPFLENVAVVIFDEFHERSLNADLALAMVQRIRGEVRPDLRIVVMSATLDAAPLATYLGGPVVESTGRMYPVEVRYAPPQARESLDAQVARETANLFHETEGHVLVFLPGVGEIRRAERALSSLASRTGAALMPLYGEMPLAEQKAVLAPTRVRKIVVATNVAETSITIDGVTGVVDSGLARTLCHDERLGINRLEIVRVSRASTEQRAGRAGRTAPGVCVRLWSQREQSALADRDVPEALRVDLSGAVLDLLTWGEADPLALPWFEPPSRAAIDRGFTLLEQLGAVKAGKPTAIGQIMARLPIHPRLARLLVTGHAYGCASRAALAAAILSERDPFRRTGARPADRAARHHSDCDLLDRVIALESLDARSSNADSGYSPHNNFDRGAARAVLRVAGELRRSLADAMRRGGARRDMRAARCRADGTDSDDEAFLRAVAAAFSDRIARRREPLSRRALMTGGRGVRLDEASAVAEAELFACVELQDLGQSESVVRQASAVRREWLDPALMTTSVEVEFDRVAERVLAVRRTRYLDLPIEEARIGAPPQDAAAELLAREAAERLDLRSLLDDDAAQFLARVRSLAGWMPELGLPTLGDDAEVMRQALPRLAAGCTSFAQLRRQPLLGVLQELLAPEQYQLVERHAPARLEVPSGGRIALHYETGKPPVLAVRIQEVFGWQATPRIAAGRVAVLLHLLGPNYRPQQITTDLASFWVNTYADVRKELKRRYPKHAWPEDPRSAKAERKPGGPPRR